MGLHYVCRCIFRKQRPSKSLLAILIIAPITSIMLDFVIMAAGYNWDYTKIIDLFKWRAAKGETAKYYATFRWDKWFARFWEFARTNFTLPILITLVLYFTIGQLLIFLETKPLKAGERRPRQFPQFWLFLIAPVSQLLVLRGALWPHQSFERPCAPFIAIAIACAIMLVADFLKKIHKYAAVAGVVILVGVLGFFCAKGTKYYYDIRWHPIEKIDMFKMLNKKIPPDKALLSYRDFVVNQHKAKGGFCLPEIAWYLDRHIESAWVTTKEGRVDVKATLMEIETKAATGKYPYYLMPYHSQLGAIINYLGGKYKYQVIKGVPQEGGGNGKPLKRGMPTYIIFDLTSNETKTG